MLEATWQVMRLGCLKTHSTFHLKVGSSSAHPHHSTTSVTSPPFDFILLVSQSYINFRISLPLVLQNYHPLYTSSMKPHLSTSAWDPRQNKMLANTTSTPHRPAVLELDGELRTITLSPIKSQWQFRTWARKRSYSKDGRMRAWRNQTASRINACDFPTKESLRYHPGGDHSPLLWAFICPEVWIC